jgi:hypothetical protein
MYRTNLKESDAYQIKTARDINVRSPQLQKIVDDYKNYEAIFDKFDNIKLDAEQQLEANKNKP